MNRPDFGVIDTHTHMGMEYCLYYPDHDADGMIRHMDAAGIETIFCSPVEDLFTGSSRREMIRDAMKRYPKRINGYYGINPMLGIDVSEIDYAFSKYPGYVGLKFLPDYHRVNLTDELYRPIFEYADRRGMLILSHTWGVSMKGESRNSVDKVATIMEKYRNITFIMGHSCQGQVDDAIRVAKTYENAYLDLCDTGRLNGVIEKMVRLAGPRKVLFGTDAPMQSFTFQMGAVLGSAIPDEEKKMILRENALRILGHIGR